jgi:hypothetical protein
MIDSDKLLILVDAADTIKASTSETNLHYYTFFAKQEGVWFSYDFQVLRSLYSVSLHEDLKILEEGRYLRTSSDYHLTEKGEQWLDNLPKEATKKTRKEIIDIIQNYINKDEVTLFKEAYARLTRGL